MKVMINISRVIRANLKVILINLENFLDIFVELELCLA